MIPAPPDERLPDGFVVRLAAGVRRRPDGALLGGSPLRLLRLAPRARVLLGGDRLAVRDATSAELAGRLLDAGIAVPVLPGRLADDVTVVIPVRDRPQGLARLLTALRDDPATAGLPVIVVDDGSAVPVVAGGRVLRHEVSRGPAAARNTGLLAAETPFVAFLDSDCVPRPGWLGRLRPHLDDPRLAMVAPRIVALDERAAGWPAAYDNVAGALDMGPEPAGVRPFSAVSYVPSAAVLARRAALGDGFDPSLRVAEDVDLVWRLAAAGWRVRYEPAAAVAHEHPARAGEWLRRRAFYGTGAARPRAGCSRSPPSASPAACAAPGSHCRCASRRGSSSAGRAPRGGRSPGRSPGTTGRSRWPPRRSPAGRGPESSPWRPPTPSPRGGRIGTGWDRSVSSPAGDSTTWRTARGSGGEPCDRGARAPCSRRVRRADPRKNTPAGRNDRPVA